MANQILKQIESKIEEAIKQKQWIEAYKYCLEVLRYTPENSKFVKLKNKIEQEVKKINTEAINNDLNRIKPLFEAGNYEQYLSELLKLQSYLKEFPEISKEIEKTKNLIGIGYQAKASNYLQTELNQIKKLEQEKQYEEALLHCKNLTEQKIQNKSLTLQIKRIKKNWVNNEIEKNKELLHSNQFEDIILFCLKLKEIDPENKIVKKLLKKTNKNLLLSKIDKKKEFIQTNLIEIKKIYKQKKYEKALKLAQEILEIDKTNTKAQMIRLKALNKVSSTIDHEIEQQIDEEFNNSTSQYQKNPENFLKI